MSSLPMLLAGIVVALLGYWAGASRAGPGEGGAAVPQATRVAAPPPPAPAAPAPAPAPASTPTRRGRFLPGGKEPPDWLVEVVDKAVPARYQELQVIGAGGMGTVLKGYDVTLRRPVAVKVPPPHLATVPEFRSRFLREGRALARLDHPNIAAIYDVLEASEGEVPALVMEFLTGQNLYERFEKLGPPSLDELIGWVRQAGGALTKVHAAGILHRDVKPDNLFLLENGTVKLLDFGLAVMEDATRLTQAGSRMGSLAYMPPEQIRGIPVNHTADQYSLASSIYHLATGELAFSLSDQIRMHPPKLSKVRAKVPAEVDPVLVRAMSAVPAERYPSIKEFVASFDFALDAVPAADRAWRPGKAAARK